MVALNFSPLFADLVAEQRKRQTIRMTARAKPGDRLQLYTGQRTKACRKLVEPDPVCVDVTYVGLTARGVTLGDKSRFPDDIDEFAKLDGFGNYWTMWKWFSSKYKTDSFTGVIIRWRPEATEVAAQGRPITDRASGVK